MDIFITVAKGDRLENNSGVKEQTKRFVTWLERFAQSWWYPAIVAGLAAADAFIFVVPIEVLLVPAVLAHRKRWLLTAFWVTLGSAIGAVALAYLAGSYGIEFMEHFMPKILHDHAWNDSMDYLNRHGALGLGIISLSPFPQHAAVAVAGLAHMSSIKVFVAVLAGRFVKYEFIAWALMYSPKLLRKLGIRVKD